MYSNRTIINTTMNRFKQNSRFAALADEIDENPKKNQYKNQNTNLNENKEGNIFKRNFHNTTPSFKTDYESRNTMRQNERRIKEEQLKKKQELEKEENIKKALSKDSFPDLIPNVVEKQPIHSMNFLKKLKNIDVENKDIKKPAIVVDEDFENLKPGWALVKKDLVTGKIITKYKKSLVPEPREKTEREIGMDIVNALVELHEKRTEEYINTWGYDTWEKMYRFPNYDYDYFNKLDELYEEMENEGSDENSDYDNDMY